ncbi:MAG: cupin domain-containing protein [Candidatus Binatia bacterium]
MISKLNKALTFLLLALAACGPKNAVYLRYGNQLTQSDLREILGKNPLAPSENIKVVTLGKGETVSHHIVQIRDRETPHVHKDHDLTVVIIKGGGYLILEDKRIELAERDVLFIPRNIVHYFVNVSRQPSVALVIFSPPYDGKDNIPVKPAKQRC